MHISYKHSSSSSSKTPSSVWNNFNYKVVEIDKKKKKHNGADSFSQVGVSVNPTGLVPNKD